MDKKAQIEKVRSWLEKHSSEIVLTPQKLAIVLRWPAVVIESDVDKESLTKEKGS